jgi:hypothetical protein
MKSVVLLLVLFLSASPLVHAQGFNPQTPQDTSFAMFSCFCENLGLLDQGWTIEVEMTDLGLDSIASVEAAPSYWKAWIRLDTLRFYKMEYAERKVVAVHELFHVLWWEAMELARKKDKELAVRREEKAVTLISELPLWQWLCNWPEN